MAKKHADPAPEEMPFEAALAELQEIVSALESGSLGLDESLERFERGTKLLKRCHVALEGAERRIEELTGFDADGNPITRQFDASATIDQQPDQPGRGKQ